MDVHIWTPDAPPRSAILLIQEIFGVGEYIRDVAERLADAGYLVGAPDLFWRFAPNWEAEHDEAGLTASFEKVQQLDFPQAVTDSRRRARPPPGPAGHHLGAGGARLLPRRNHCLGCCGDGRAELLRELLRLGSAVDARHDHPGVVPHAVPLRQQRCVHPQRRHRRDQRGDRRPARLRAQRGDCRPRVRQPSERDVLRRELRRSRRGARRWPSWALTSRRESSRSAARPAPRRGI